MMKLKLQQFAAPGSTNPLREETFENLQLNAGIFIKNLKYTGTGAPTDATTLKTLITNIINGTETGKGEILGATRGGGTFNVTREIRTPEIDGLRYKFKKGDFIDSVDAYLTTTLIEMTPETLCAALGIEVPSNVSNVTTLKLPTALTDDSYLDNLCWIGDISDGRLVLICLENAINTADLTLTFADKNEGALGVEFHACQSEVNDYDEAPFEIVYFKPAA